MSAPLPGETTYAFKYGVSAAPFDANGNAVLTIGPALMSHNDPLFQPAPVIGERWIVGRYTTFCSGFGCQLVIYKNIISDPYVVDATLNAESDSGGIATELQWGDVMIFSWSRGTPGDTVSYAIYGVRYVRGTRSYGSDRLRRF
jgi:hypothetical protein